MNLKLAAIIFFATVLRISALNNHDFWFDEAFTYQIAKLPLKELLSAVLSDNNPPLYYLIMHYVLKFGQNEIILRLPSILFSIATIPLVFTITKKLINQKVANLSVLLFSISPLSIYISTEARLHSLTTFILAAIIATFFYLLENPNLKTIIAFILFLILGLYTQYYIALLLIPFTLFIIQKKSVLSLKKWVRIASVPTLFLLPWLAVSTQVNHALCWCPNTLLSLPASLVAPAIAGVGIVTMRSFTGLPLPLIALFLTASTVILMLFIKGLIKENPFSKIYITLILIVSMLGLFLPVFSPKGFTIFLPIYLMITAIGINSIKLKKTVTTALLLLLGIIVLVQINNPFFRGERIKDAYILTKENLSAPIYHTSLVTYYSFDFYSQEQQKNILLTPSPLNTTITKFIGGEKKSLDDTSPQTFWLVDTNKWAPSAERDNVLSSINSNYQKYQSKTIDHVTVALFKQK